MSDIFHFSSDPLVIATRKSDLALYQAHLIRDSLQKIRPDLSFSLLPLLTQGDRLADVQNWQNFASRGLFVKQLELALACGDAFCAVHSLKDVPSVLSDDFRLVWMGFRENPADAFVSAHYGTLDDVPVGGRIGTSSIRRSAQLKHYRADLQVLPLRGNVLTRLKKMTELALDGVILSAAGLTRLGLAHRISQYLPFSVCVPAPGQGFLTIETRREQADLSLWKVLGDPQESTLALLERRLASLLNTNCHVPFGANARYDGDRIFLHARLLSVDGQKMIEFHEAAHDGEDSDHLAWRAFQYFHERQSSL